MASASGSFRRPVVTSVSWTVIGGDISKEVARAQLDAILNSAPFRTSKRCSSLLRYIAEQALDGHADQLKERTLGIAVFGRLPSYDTNQDPVVRITAGEVRKRLAQYYQEAGHETEIRIDVPAGSYMPEFHSPATSPLPPIAVEVPRRSFLWRYIAAAAAVAAGGLLAWLHPWSPPTSLDKFWAPIFDNAAPVLLSVGQPKPYDFGPDLQRKIEDRLLLRDTTPGDLTFTMKDLVPAWERYVVVGDAICLSRFTALFAQKRKAYRVRAEATTTLADLRDGPAVLIGAFNNEWTLRLTGQLRFTFQNARATGHEGVRDAQNPAKRDWDLVNSWPLWKIPEDYAIVSRVLDPTTGRMVVIAAGITHFGTMTAGEFLTNAAYMDEFVNKAPHDWTHKNFQVVLATKVIGGNSGPPRVLATHFW